VPQRTVESAGGRKVGSTRLTEIAVVPDGAHGASSIEHAFEYLDQSGASSKELGLLDAALSRPGDRLPRPDHSLERHTPVPIDTETSDAWTS
jgi:hypothetical protein